MRNATCPKCGASSVYTRTARISRGDGGVHVYTGGVTKPSRLDDYACTRCGYIESYIPDLERLLAVEKSWSKVG
jgi:ribosomal protein S27AE